MRQHSESGGAVVVPVLEVGVVVQVGGVVVGGPRDLVLRHGHVDLAVVVVDGRDRPSGDEPLLAEDPEAGVHDHVGRGGVVGGLVDLADRTISGLDVVPDQVMALGPRVLAVRPHVVHEFPP